MNTKGLDLLLAVFANAHMDEQEEQEKKCFCEEIQTYEKITKGPFRGGYYPPKNEDSIVYDPKTKTFDIWSDGGGDPFQAGPCVEDIKFCPVCGKELKKGAEE